MAILTIIDELATITPIGSTVKSIIELVDKIYLEPNKKAENLEQIENLCNKAYKELSENGKLLKTRILTTEEEKIIRKAVNEDKLDHKQALICKLALENNFTMVEMIVRNLKKD